MVSFTNATWLVRTKPISFGETLASMTMLESEGTISTTRSPALTVPPSVDTRTRLITPSMGARIAVLSALSAITALPPTAVASSPRTFVSSVSIVACISCM